MRPIPSTPPWWSGWRPRGQPGAGRPAAGVRPMAAYARLTPVIVVTGFLGSGKTTLLNHMLRHPSLADAAVLVNEFGAVGLDHFLVEAMDANTVLLESGCLCCTIRGDLKDAIIDLNSRRARGEIPPYRRLIVETTGLADPAPILFTLSADTMLKHHYRLGSVVTTVDGVNGLRQLKRHPESVKQATVADRIVLTKPDIAEADTLARLRAKLTRLNGSADQITAVNGEVDVPRVLRADVYDPRTKGAEVRRWLAAEAEKDAADDRAEGHGHDISRHDEHIHSFTLSFEGALDWTAFGIWLTMLLHTHGEKVLRVKGILNVAGTEAPVVVNGVQHVVHPPIHLAAWPTDDRRSHIVFIVDDPAQTPSSAARRLQQHRRRGGLRRASCPTRSRSSAPAWWAAPGRSSSPARATGSRSTTGRKAVRGRARAYRDQPGALEGHGLIDDPAAAARAHLHRPRPRRCAGWRGLRAGERVRARRREARGLRGDRRHCRAGLGLSARRPQGFPPRPSPRGWA